MKKPKPRTVRGLLISFFAGAVMASFAQDVLQSRRVRLDEKALLQMIQNLKVQEIQSIQNAYAVENQIMEKLVAEGKIERRPSVSGIVNPQEHAKWEIRFFQLANSLYPKEAQRLRDLRVNVQMTISKHSDHLKELLEKRIQREKAALGKRLGGTGLGALAGLGAYGAARQIAAYKRRRVTGPPRRHRGPR